MQPLDISRYEGYWTSATFNLTCLFKIYAALEVDEVGDPGEFRVSLKIPFQLTRSPSLLEQQMPK